MKIPAQQPIGGMTSVTPTYNNFVNPVSTVQPVGINSGYIPTSEVVSPMGISITSITTPTTSSSVEGLFNNILSLLPDEPNSNQAIAHLKSLIQNRKLSVDRDMSPVAKVFGEKITNGLKTLLATDYQAFDRVIDNIISKEVPNVAPVQVNNKSKYAGVVDNGINELLRATINYMQKQKIVNVGNMGKFNKVITDMIADTKSKKFSDIISKVSISELYNGFKKFVGGAV